MAKCWVSPSGKQVNGSDDRCSVPAKATVIQIATTATSEMWVIRPSVKHS